MMTSQQIIEWSKKGKDGLTHITRLYDKFRAMYADRFMKQFEQGSQQNQDDLTQAWLSTWSEGLAGLTTLEIQTGLQSSLNVEWPPSLPQFRNLCKPLPDYETLFNEACREIGKHAATRKWTSLMAYHGANVFGHFELKNATWSAAKTRWTKIIDEMRAIGELDPIPEYHEALPKPGRTTPDMKRINHYLADLHRIVGNQDRAKELGQ